MATTTHPCVVLGQGKFSVFRPKSSSIPEFLSTKHSNLCVSVPYRPFSASISTRKSSSSPIFLRNCVSIDDSGSSSCNEEDDSDWEFWSQHFSEIDKIDSLVSHLKIQLEKAIEIEDFKEAAKLKKDIVEATWNDTVAEIMLQLQAAISEERYRDASRLCSVTGSGLLGWWVGCSEDSEEPFGRIVHITQGVGRFIGKSYSPRQLLTAAAGTPLFEIFVVKDAIGEYVMQVVYFQRVEPNMPISEISDLRAEQSSAVLIKKPSILDVGGGEVKEDKKEDTPLIGKEPTEEGIKNVLSFLKDRIPGIKVRLVKEDVKIPEEEIVSSDDVTEELVGEGIEETNYADEEEGDIIEDISSMDSDDIRKHLKKSIEDMSSVDSADIRKHWKKLFIGGVLHNTEDSSTKDELVRVSADIIDIERDSFILHVPRRSKDGIDNTVSKEQVTSLQALRLSDLMPPEVAKAFWGAEKASLKVSRNVREFIKLAVSQARNGNQLSEYTTFNRIISPDSNIDPFDGLYVGAFGPYGTEIVQIKRKYGRWDDDDESDSSDVEPYEYVEAVKLTGDPNVPAGQVTFRAKIGKGSTWRSGTRYPEELGVLATYGGQGRIAEIGFKNPKWVAGKLLKLNGKGMEPYTNGADLGFVYMGPDSEQSFLVLFNRLRLPE
ncbi:hypothetical protein AALP_AA7G037200 [Arabis alpina]|uniref:Uncharacterized protein n=1 Tax=Arabis alpina TaxID=50452 RepID=A0A087GFR0_ARAAL|nr:hypothetical protein AALP_AA7G037200 [Arabis alpina]